MKIRTLYIVFMVIIMSFIYAGYSSSADSGNGTDTVPLILNKLPEFGISKGEVLYSRYCVFCHGESGLGDGLNAYSIPVKPLSLADREEMKRKPDEELEKVISAGGPSRGLSQYMPAFGNTLSSLQVKHLVDFIREELPERGAGQ